VTKLTYAQTTTEHANPIVRFSHNSRIKQSIKIINQRLPYNGSILDFGAGTGYFLNSIAHTYPNACLYAYEPHMKLQGDSYTQINGLVDLDSASLNVITAFEVCEHLYEEEIHQFLEQSKRLLKLDGVLIISVPIMYGPVVIPKELNQMFLKGNQFSYSLEELYNVLLGKPILRPDTTLTHKGFDFRWLENIIKGYFKSVKKSYSPFKPFPWYLNSQCFFDCSQ
jgi:2-polyprenyl-3-methyl-5-hydroxy-6-metoxy-1,4-benzoquinol methylase